VDGKIGGNMVTLELKAPRGERAVHVYAAGWVASGNPPSPKVAYQIDYSTDGGKTWLAVVKDWKVIRREPEPADFWSQSFCWGDVSLPEATTSPVRVRFRNDGGKSYRKVEAHLAYELSNPSPAQLTFAWTEGAGPLKTATRAYGAATGSEERSWKVPAGKNVDTKWVEFAAN
jgi:hypothetical protein